MTLQDQIVLDELDAYKQANRGLQESEIALSRRLLNLQNMLTIALGYLRSGQYEAARQVLEHLT